MTTEKNIAIAGYFSGEMNRLKVLYFERIQEAFRPRDISLFLLNLSNGHVETSCNAVNVVENCCFQGTFEKRCLNNKLERKLEESAGIHHAMMQNDSLEISKNYIYTISKELAKFCLSNGITRILLWAQFQPLNLFAYELLGSCGIRCGFVHLGLLPGTISLSVQGEMAESWLLAENPTFCCLPVSQKDLKRAKNYLMSVRTTELNRKRHPEKGKLRSRIKKYRDYNSIILYAGINDFCSGILPRWHDRASLHSPFFKDSEDGLSALAFIADKMDAKIVYKAHPNLKEGNVEQVDKYRGIVIPANDTNLFECLDGTCLTATILSQTAYMALTREKPVLLMGRMPLSGKGCAYELENRQQLHEILCCALEKGLTEKQRGLWVRHVAQLLKYALFSFNPEFDGLFCRGPETAALWLRQF